MKEHRELTALMAQAKAERRCIVAPNERLAKALRRRRQAGELFSPYPALFVEPELWNGLAVDEQSRWMTAALTLIHPQWVFTGLSAASAFRLWIHRSLHCDRSVQIASATVPHGERSDARLKHIYTPTTQITRKDGVPVTGIVQTLITCGARYDFIDTLPLMDSALRAQLTDKGEMSAALAEIRYTSVRRRMQNLIRFANPLSENGGESMCRATMIDLGFPVPRLQVAYPNPRNRDWPLRVDFEFTAVDGSTVAVEFDGERKYVDPAMNRGKSVSETVYDERRREDLLKGYGIGRFVRINFREMIRKTPMARKLLAAGIPLAHAYNQTSAASR